MALYKVGDGGVVGGEVGTVRGEVGQGQRLGVGTVAPGGDRGLVVWSGEGGVEKSRERGRGLLHHLTIPLKNRKSP